MGWTARESNPGCLQAAGAWLWPLTPLLVPWSRKGRFIPLLPLQAVQPVHSLSACTGGHFNFFYLTDLVSNMDVQADSAANKRLCKGANKNKHVSDHMALKIRFVAHCKHISCPTLRPVSQCNIETWTLFLGAFANLRRKNISFVMFVRPSVLPSVWLSAWNSSDSTGMIFMKFGFSVFFENMSRKFKFRYNRTTITSTLDGD